MYTPAVLAFTSRVVVLKLKLNIPPPPPGAKFQVDFLRSKGPHKQKKMADLFAFGKELVEIFPQMHLGTHPGSKYNERFY